MERQLKNLIHTTRAWLDQDPGKSLVSPERDWRVLLLIFMVFSVCVVAWSTALFIAINGDDFVSLPEKRTSNQTFTRDELDHALSYLKGKEEYEKALLTRPPSVVDPSK